MNPEPGTMSALIADLQLLFTQVMTNLATIATTIVGSPLLLLTVAMMFTGVMFAFFKRLISSY